jgi:photosystem II stability/assembly factor-like uncharacterized protein
MICLRLPTSLLLPLLLSALLPFGSGLSYADDAGARTESSERAPLASRSLITDAVVTGTSIIAVGDLGHILLAPREEDPWQQVLAPSRSMLTAIASDQKDGLFAVGHESTILVSKDRGASWAPVRSPLEERQALLAVHFSSPSEGFIVGGYGTILETNDGGASWESHELVSAESGEREDRHLYDIAELPSGKLVMVGESGALYGREKDEDSWKALSSPYAGTLFGALACRDGTLIVYGLRGHAFRSRDGGATWESLVTNTTLSIFAGHERPSGEVVLGGASGLMLVASACDSNFKVQSRPDRKAITSLLSLPSGKLLVVGEAGIMAPNIVEKN